MPSDTFDTLCGQLHEILVGSMRQDLNQRLSRRPRLGEALRELRPLLQHHRWTTGSRVIPLAASVTSCDATTQREGFHALHDWDGIADHVNPHTIPVDVLDFLIRTRGDDTIDPVALSVLVDYHLFHLLSLAALRAWDTGDPDAALARVGALLDLLQGPAGSGQQFVSDPETLLLIATSHYEPDERGYHLLLQRVRTLPYARQRAVAFGHAACLGSHLRFGMLATYAGSIDAMRQDNAADYPWLEFAADVVIQEVERQARGGADGPAPALVVEALCGALTADAGFLLDQQSVRERLAAHQTWWGPLLHGCVPRDEAYSPLALVFNFSYNVLKGTVVDALLRGDAWTVSFNDLLTGQAGGNSPVASRTALAHTLTGHARRHPQRIRGQLMPVIAYDPAVGRALMQATIARLQAVGMAV